MFRGLFSFLMFIFFALSAVKRWLGLLYSSLLLISVISLVYLNAIGCGCTFCNLTDDLFIFLWIHLNYGFPLFS